MVFTHALQGDESGVRGVVDRGLTQGVPSSPELFNVLMDTLLDMVKSELAVAQVDGAGNEDCQVMAFSDDVVIQVESDVEAAVAARAATRWERWEKLKFNLKAGKSGVLVGVGGVGVGSGVVVDGEEVLGSAEEDYLRAAVDLKGATASSLLRRVKGSQAELMAL